MGDIVIDGFPDPVLVVVGNQDIKLAGRLNYKSLSADQEGNKVTLREFGRGGKMALCFYSHLLGTKKSIIN